MKPLRRLRTVGCTRLSGIVLPGLLAALLPGIAHGATGGTTASTGGAAPYSQPPYTTPVTPTVSGPNPLANLGMWIWELPSTDHGNLTEIVDQAKADKIKAVMVKSSDGTNMWSQFTPQMVKRFHAAHIKVCAWQYVYGSKPTTEAALGAQAVRDGADCLLIDAEGEYEGKYVSAQTYMTSLRHLVGKNFPIALAGLPYIDYHPGFPYSVFLGPGGAQYDMPQMYWHDIGTSVDAVFAHTYAFNQLYQRQIFPLGQVYAAPPVSQVLRFRQDAKLYRAKGVSWWDWQEARPKYFAAVSKPLTALRGLKPADTYATLGKGAEGDVVVWAQEHLDGDGFKLTIDGAFGKQTAAAVAQFQIAGGLPATGEIDPTTWALLLKVKPITVTWEIKKKKVVAVTSAARLAAADGTAPLVQTVPQSARLPDRGHDIPPSLGARGTD